MDKPSPKAAEQGDSEAEKMVAKLQEKLAVRKHDKSVLEERLEAASEKLANEKNQKNSVEPTKEQQKTDRSEI